MPLKKLTVPATDLDDMKVLALNLDNPKSQTYISKNESQEMSIRIQPNS